MARVSEVRPGPLDTKEDQRKAIEEIVTALNALIKQFNETQPEE